MLTYDTSAVHLIARGSLDFRQTEQSACIWIASWLAAVEGPLQESHCVGNLGIMPYGFQALFFSISMAAAALFPDTKLGIPRVDVFSMVARFSPRPSWYSLPLT